MLNKGRIFSKWNKGVVVVYKISKAAKFLHPRSRNASEII